MFQLTLAVALASISVLGILFNSAILSSLMNKLQLQTIANIFFFNQALADVLFLSLLPLIGTEYYLNRWIFGEVRRDYQNSIFQITETSSFSLIKINPKQQHSELRYFALNKHFPKNFDDQNSKRFMRNLKNTYHFLQGTGKNSRFPRFGFFRFFFRKR